MKLIAAAAALLAASSLSAGQVGNSESEVLTAADLETATLWKPSGYYDPFIDYFLADAEQLNKANAGQRQAIAARYALTVPSLDATISFLRRMQKDRYDRRRSAELRQQALELVKLSKRAPIALMFAAGALGQLANGGCSSGDVATLMEGSRNADFDLWAIASTCSSSDALAIAIDKSNSARPALLYLGLRWTNGDPSVELAAADMLLRPEFLSQVHVAQRDEVLADVARYKLTNLLRLGLLREALAFGDSLDPATRAFALKAQRSMIRTSISGFGIKTSESWGSAAIDYAAALALGGRNAEARAMLDSIAPASLRAQVRTCIDAAKPQCAITEAFENGVPLGALVVDQLLDRPDADPYPLLERAAIGTSLSMDGGAVTEALCRLLSRPNERQDCEELRDRVAAERDRQFTRAGDRALWTAVERAGGQPFQTAKARYAPELAKLGAVKARRDWTRSTIDPAPVPFREQPLSAATLAKRPLVAVDLKALAPLPKGYTPVRIERSGKRAVAISLSQRFDPNGEVTAGGYWLHLSEDGGSTWQAPLYTGLAEHFPYIVSSSSRLPMMAGDRIHLEVEESLIDTASITYPPVGMRLRRKRTGIYVDIPITELRKDSDGDGITDLAARHLLLDGSARDGAPFVVGRDGACSAPPSAEKLARLEILKKLFEVEAKALIEPVAAKRHLLGDWRTTEAPDKAPIFILGSADDYRCVAIDRLMVVYGKAHERRLRTFSPDFHLVELPRIRWNRNRSRGFVQWSTGWAGGTFRLVPEGNAWKLEPISQWIT